LAMFMPFGQESWTRDVQLGGTPPRTDAAQSLAEGKTVHVMYNTVTADYFRTIGLPLLSGREFTRSESRSKPPFPVAIVTKDLADRLWPGQDPLGRSIQFPADNPNGQPLVMQVVAVAPRMLWDLFEKDHTGMVITPLGQDFHSTMRLHVRVMANADPASTMSLVRQTLRDIDPDIPLVEMKQLNLVHSESMSVRMTKVGATLFGAFGGVALLLSFIGVYGLKAYSVARRTREIGIRMALGATARDVVLMIVSEGTRMAAIGLLIGLALAVGVGKLTDKFLYGVTGSDPVIFALIPIALAAVALIACWLPARRAARVNPMIALRCE
jgi:putative ABC transport system permease protein